MIVCQKAPAPPAPFPPYQPRATWRGKGAKTNECDTLMNLMGRVPHSLARGRTRTVRVGRGGRVGSGSGDSGRCGGGFLRMSLVARAGGPGQGGRVGGGGGGGRGGGWGGGCGAQGGCGKCGGGAAGAPARSGCWRGLAGSGCATAWDYAFGHTITGRAIANQRCGCAGGGSPCPCSRS